MRIVKYKTPFGSLITVKDGHIIERGKPMTIEDIANELRVLEAVHAPDGYPAVKMGTISKLLDFIDDVYHLAALSEGRCVCHDLRRECERNYD